MTYKARRLYSAHMRVLFVCSGNAFRSPVAEALLRKMRPDVEVDSAGLNPVINVAESARRYLARENAERYLKQVSESLAGKNLETYDRVICMEERHRDAVIDMCPQCDARVVVWSIEDPYFMPHGSSEKIFNQIRRRVEQLADSL